MISYFYGKTGAFVYINTGNKKRGNTMKIGICDDINAQAQALAAQVDAYFRSRGYLYDILLFSDGRSLLASQEVFDLLLLDWDLPDTTGLALAQVMRTREPAPTVVFVSAYKDYVFDSFEAAPFRYLVKPVTDEQVTKTLDSFLEYFDRDSTVTIPTREEPVFLRLRDIIYIEADKKHAIVRFNAPKHAEINFYESTRSLAELTETIRSPRFFRTHKSFLVNMDYIKDINDDTILLTVGEYVSLSRRNRPAFERAYNEFLRKSF